MSQTGVYKNIKPNVWKWTYQGSAFSLKKYSSIAQAQKIRDLHDKLLSIQFPFVLPVLPSADGTVIVQPWLQQAKSANYALAEDRTNTLNILHQLHRTNDFYNWADMSCLTRYNILQKWQERLEKFTAQADAVVPHIGAEAVRKMIEYAEQAIQKIEDTPRKPQEVTLLHGDIVHHNFIQQSNGTLRLIDFDLATLGNAEDEIMLWIHRVLPQIDYDLDSLLKEQPSLQQISPESFSLLCYPNELLREWLYMNHISDDKKQPFLKELTKFTYNALSYWPKLWYDIEKILEDHKS